MDTRNLIEQSDPSGVYYEAWTGIAPFFIEGWYAAEADSPEGYSHSGPHRQTLEESLEDAQRYLDGDDITGPLDTARVIHCEPALKITIAAELGDHPTPSGSHVRERGDLWTALDWTLWGVGMADVFREPLADKMITTLTDDEFGQATALIQRWNELRGGPVARNYYVELKAHNAQAHELMALAQRLRDRNASADDWDEFDRRAAEWATPEAIERLAS